MVKLRISDVAHGGQVQTRAMVMQQKTHQPVQFEITEQTRESVAKWIRDGKLAAMITWSKADSKEGCFSTSEE